MQLKKHFRNLEMIIDIHKMNYTPDDIIFNYVEWFKDSIIEVYLAKAQPTLEYLSEKLELKINIDDYKQGLQ
jgi:hypothetical protein